ncbi:MAG: hypothetical protein H5T97_07190, partial [Firmicutes bacterium]|nr:hypothetical protein [Bacillota bacterium]
ALPFLVLLALCLWFARPGEAAPTPQPAKPREAPPPPEIALVLVLVVDGLQAGALERVDAPTMNGLAASGVRVSSPGPPVPRGEGEFRRSTGADNRAAFRGQNSPSDDLATCAAAVLAGGGAVTVAQQLEARGAKTAFFDGSDGGLKSLASGVSQYFGGPYGGRNRAVVDALLAELGRQLPYLVVAVLPELRPVLDRSGDRGTEYLEAVRATDVQVGRLIGFLHGRGLFERTLVVVAGTGRQPALVLKGPPLREGVVLPPADLADVGPTLAYVTGVELPGARGLVLWNALAPRPDHTESYLLQRRVEDLSRALAGMREEVRALQAAREAVEEERRLLEGERASVAQAIGERNERIRRLEGRVRLMVRVGLALAAGFLVGYWLEYRWLRKKFLMF